MRGTLGRPAYLFQGRRGLSTTRRRGTGQSAFAAVAAGLDSAFFSVFGALSELVDAAVSELEDLPRESFL